MQPPSRVIAAVCFVSIAISCHDSSSGPANELPRIVSTAPPSAMLGKPFRYQIAAVDPDRGGALAFVLQLGPAGALVDMATGILSWTPVLEGSFDFEVAVEDSSRGRSIQAFTVGVTSAPTRLMATSPLQGEQAVALTRETILAFDRPIDPNTLGAGIRVQSGGADLAVRIVVSPDERRATLFYDEPLPPASLVQVLLAGDDLLDAGQVPLDADGDGVEGGLAVVSFSTITIVPVDQTAVCGRVFASEYVGTAPPVDNGLAGVEIRVEGAEPPLKTVTDAMGNFRLEPAPAGRVFVVIDGRTVDPPPVDGYYPTVGKPFETSAGHETNVGNIYLPLIPPDALIDVNDTDVTVVEFPPSVEADNPELAGTRLLVPPGSLYSDDGTPGGKAGISPVPSDRIPGRLPGFLKFPIVFTVQTDGATNFAVPAPVRFPNLPDLETGEKLAPGEKTALWSFNHDAGRWEVVGSMTVTNDGAYVDSDPGVGIQAPGWHGSRPGLQCNGGPPLPPPPCSPITPPDYLTSKQGVCINYLAPELMDLVFSNLIPDCFASLGFHPLGGTSVAAPRLSAGRDSCHTKTSAHYANLAVDISGIDNRAPPKPSVSEERFGRFSDEELKRLIACIADVSVGSLSCSGANCETLFELNGAPFRIIAERLGTDNSHLHIELLDDLNGYDACQPAPAPECDCFNPPPFRYYDRQQKKCVSCPTVVTSSRIASRAGNPASMGPFYVLVNQAGFVQQLKTDESGLFSVFAAPRDRGITWLYSPVTNRVWASEFYAPLPGSIISLTQEELHDWEYQVQVEDDITSLESWGPFMEWEPDGSEDTDGDGLGLFSESLVGTLPTEADTDGDGIEDLAELQAGTDPGNPLQVRTGIVGSAPTLDYATDVFALNDLVLVADASAGLAVFNVFNGMEPALVGQVDTAGIAQGVSLLGSLALVADGPGGVAAIDLTSVPTPTTQWVADIGDVRCVQTVADTVIAGTRSGDLFALDALTGAMLDDVHLGGPVEDVTVLGSTLYAIANGYVHVIPFRPEGLIVVNTELAPGTLSARRRRIFAEEGALYVTQPLGYDTFDIRTDPLDPAPFDDVPGATGQRGWRQIVTNGAGLGVAAVGDNQDGSPPSDVNIYETSDPQVTDELLAPFLTPGTAEAVALYNGLAYVADGEAGLQVINYKAYDSGGLAPSVTLATTPDQVTLEENSFVLVRALVSDDVQVRNVELFVGGTVASVDGNHPYEFFVRVPRIQAGELTVGVRASDTGGNRTAIVERSFAITPDSTSPRLAANFPVDGQFVSRDFGSFKLTFSESMDRAAVESAVSLAHSGADMLFGTPDDPSVPFDASFSNEDRRVNLVIGQVPLGLLRLRVLGGVATDLAGNVLDFDGDGTPGDSGVIEVQALECTTSWNSVGGNFGLGIDGAVNALEAVDARFPTGPALFVGGTFNTAAGVFFARWDGVSWEAPPTHPALASGVTALAALMEGTSQALYVATPGSILRWDGVSWSTVAANVDGYVWCMLSFDSGDGPELYVGGQFIEIDGVLANGIAHWDGTQWRSLGTGLRGSPAFVFDLADWQTDQGPILVVAGQFSSSGPQTFSHLAGWNGSAWVRIGDDPPTNLINSVAIFDDGGPRGAVLHAMGAFNFAGRQINGRWEPLGLGVENNFCSYGKGDLIVFDDVTGRGPALFAGGCLVSVGGMAEGRGIGRWDGERWSGLDEGFFGTAGYPPFVHAFEAFQGPLDEAPKLYVGGARLTTVGSDQIAVGGLARWGCIGP